MKNIVKGTVLFAFVFILASCGKKEGGTGEKVQLRFQPETGKEYHTEMTIHSETKMMGMSIPLEMVVEYKMVPEEVSDSTVLVRFEYARIFMKMQNPMTGAVEYDSKTPEEAKGIGADKIAEIYSDIIGTSFKVKFDPYGNVLETLDVSPDMNQVMGAFSNATDMKQYLQNVVPAFPDYPVAKGDSWNKTIVTEDEAGLKIETTYTVKKVTDQTVELELNGKVIPAVKDSANMMIEVSGTLDGDMTIDRSSGWTVDGLIIQELNMKITRGMQSVNGTASNRIEIKTK